ncbi:MAG: trimeric intracellular cation channel family protein, partial [Candidatus Planktophila sp.]
MSLMLTLDLLATFAFALVGARVAADKGLDYGGIAFIAAVASLSGGTLRNVFLGIRPVWIIDPWIVISVLSAIILTLVFRRVTHIGKTLLLMDTFGLAVAAMSGTQLAYEMDVVWFGAIFLGVITAVTGGLVRDVLCQLEPVLLHRETIGTSTLIGASTYVALHGLGFADNVAAIAGGLVVIVTRLVSIRFDLHLPKF